MKTAIYLILTAITSTSCFLMASTISNPIPAYAAGLAVWVLFLWGYYKRSRRAAQRKFQEHMFQQHMRSILHNPRY